MAVTIVQTGYKNIGAASSGSITLTSNVGVGNIGLICHQGANNNPITSITGGGYPGWAKLLGDNSVALGVVEVWAPTGVSTGGSLTLTVNYGSAGSGSDEVYYQEYPAGSKLVVANATGSTAYESGGPYSSMSTSSLSVQAGALLFAFAKTEGNGGTFSAAPSGFTAVSGLSNTSHAMAYETGLATGSDSITYAIVTTNDNGYIGLIEIVTGAVAITAAVSPSGSVTPTNKETAPLTLAVSPSVAPAYVNTEKSQLTSLAITASVLATPTNKETVPVTAAVSPSLTVATTNKELAPLASAVAASASVALTNKETAPLTITVSASLVVTPNDSVVGATFITAAIAPASTVTMTNKEAVAITSPMPCVSALGQLIGWNSFQDGLDNFSIGNSDGTVSSIATSTAQSHTGTMSLAVGLSGAGNGQLWGGAFTISPGEEIAATAWMFNPNSGDTGAIGSIQVGFYDTSFSNLGYVYGANATLTPNTWIELPPAVGVAPAGTMYVLTIMSMVPGAAETIYMDDVIISQALVDTTLVSLTAPVSAQSLVGGTAGAYNTLMTSLSPVGRWRLNDAIGAGTLADASGNANVAYYYGNMTLQALSPAPGTTGMQNDSTGTAYVLDNALLDFGTGSFSAICFIKAPTIPTNFPTPMSKQGYPDVSPAGWRFYIDTNGALHCYVEDASSNSVDRNTTGTSVCDNNWHMGVLVADRTAQTLVLYLDGALASQGSASSISGVGSVSNVSYLYINSTVAGTQVESAVLNYALTPAQVAKLWASLVPNMQASVAITASITPAATVSFTDTVAKTLTSAITASLTVSAISHEATAITASISTSTVVGLTNFEAVAVTTAISGTAVMSATALPSGGLTTSITPLAAVSITSTERVAITGSISGSLVVSMAGALLDQLTAVVSPSVVVSMTNHLSASLSCSVTASLSISATSIKYLPITVAVSCSAAASFNETSGTPLTFPVLSAASVSAANHEATAVTVTVLTSAALSATSTEQNALTVSITATLTVTSADVQTRALTVPVASSVVVTATNTERAPLAAAISSSLLTGAVNAEHVALAAAVLSSVAVSITDSVHIVLTAAISPHALVAAASTEHTPITAHIASLLAITYQLTYYEDLLSSIQSVLDMEALIDYFRATFIGRQSMDELVQPVMTGQQQSMSMNPIQQQLN